MQFFLAMSRDTLLTWIKEQSRERGKHNINSRKEEDRIIHLLIHTPEPCQEVIKKFITGI